jgi:ABC-type Mn2+/Zn2+ transport system ATPase subunit
VPVAVEVERVSVAFGARPALSDISFRVPAGTFLGMLGPNGAGKTTLLRALLGAVEYTGRIVVDGRTGYVPQLGAVANEFPVDALGVVLMGRYPRLGWVRRAGRDDRRAALALLEEVGLGQRARTPFGDLSGGQRQRVLVARALAQEGDVLLLDEPLTGVDATSQDAILGVVAHRCATGRTVCMTTHDLAQAARVCDRLLLLDREVVAEGTVEEVFRPDVLRRAYGDDLLFTDGRRALLAEDHHHHDHDP